jgi:PPOX class probable F420-dependent enzyme
MTREDALQRIRSARVGRLATADAAGVPHVVPFVFALYGETLYWAVDQKPKRSLALKRLDNIRVNPNVEVLVDEYSDDWAKLWWVRASGTARILDDGKERGKALALLCQKFDQYGDKLPEGPVVAVDITRLSFWEAK